jgi:hypothetical protein
MATKKADSEQDPKAPEGTEPVQEQSASEPDTTQSDVSQLADEVLGGRWGEHHVARKGLADAGHDATAVLSAVNRRISAGAPSAYKPTAVGLVEQVRNGEWGPDKGLDQRLTAAGFSSAAVAEVRRSLSTKE